jgi:polyisoprenoid-binding protein YceI
MRLLLITASAISLAACDNAPIAVPGGANASPTPATVEAVDVTYGSAGTYNLDITHTSLLWRVSHFGLSNYTANFTGISGTLEFNPDDPAATRLSVTIDPASVETNYRGDYAGTHPNSPFSSWNEALAKDERWFNAGAHPQITFVSTNIEPTGPATGRVIGDLTFRGTTRPVTLDVRYNGVQQFQWAPDVDVIGFSAQTKINRSDLGMTALAPAIGDEVEIIIETEFRQVQG